MVPFKVIFPVLVLLPIVRPLPDAVELRDVLRVTTKLVVLPTIVREPLLKALVISDTLIVELAVTVRIPPLSDQPEPELAADEMVRVWLLTLAVINKMTSIGMRARRANVKCMLMFFAFTFFQDRRQPEQRSHPLPSRKSDHRSHPNAGDAESHPANINAHLQTK